MSARRRVTSRRHSLRIRDSLRNSVRGSGTPFSTEEQLRKLYYDLAGSPGSNALAPLLEMTERSHILYGSDYVHTPESVVSAHLAELLSSKLLSAEDFRAIGRGNALALFPRLN